MPLMEWTQDLSVDISSIDNQHKKLISLINQLHEARLQGRGKEMVGETLTALIDYTRTHFSFEEKLFDTHGYPASASHKEEHLKLIDQVLDYKNDFAKGDLTLSTDLMIFLKDWLRNHILGVDKKYTEFLKSKGVE